MGDPLPDTSLLGDPLPDTSLLGDPHAGTTVGDPHASTTVGDPPPAHPVLGDLLLHILYWVSLLVYYRGCPSWCTTVGGPLTSSREEVSPTNLIPRRGEKSLLLAQGRGEESLLLVQGRRGLSQF